MIKPINNLDEAQFKHELRDLYKKIGYKGMLQVIYEIIQSANIAIEVTCEEIKEKMGE